MIGQMVSILTKLHGHVLTAPKPSLLPRSIGRSTNLLLQAAEQCLALLPSSSSSSCAAEDPDSMFVSDDSLCYIVVWAQEQALTQVARCYAVDVNATMSKFAELVLHNCMMRAALQQLAGCCHLLLLQKELLHGSTLAAAAQPDTAAAAAARNR